MPKKRRKVEKITCDVCGKILSKELFEGKDKKVINFICVACQKERPFFIPFCVKNKEWKSFERWLEKKRREKRKMMSLKERERDEDFWTFWRKEKERRKREF